VEKGLDFVAFLAKYFVIIPIFLLLKLSLYSFKEKKFSLELVVSLTNEQNNSKIFLQVKRKVLLGFFERIKRD